MPTQPGCHHTRALHLVAIDDGANLESNLGLAAQRPLGARDGVGDVEEVAFGCGPGMPSDSKPY
jgi:hypothetical protein